MENKRCHKCKNEKSINDFYSDKRQKDGKSTYCIECRKAYNNRKIKCVHGCGKEISYSNLQKHRCKGATKELPPVYENISSVEDDHWVNCLLKSGHLKLSTPLKH